MLPHAYPFRLVERASGPAGGAALAWTLNGALSRGGGELPAMLALEMMAQSALVALPAAGVEAGGAPAAAATRGLLAGVDGLRFLAPVRPGDTLSARATLVGRFGRLVKARVTLSRPRGTGEEAVAEGELLLAIEAGGVAGG